jgi:hypothetical protein
MQGQPDKSILGLIGGTVGRFERLMVFLARIGTACLGQPLCHRPASLSVQLEPEKS